MERPLPRGTEADLPQWKSHKLVRAGKIMDIKLRSAAARASEVKDGVGAADLVMLSGHVITVDGVWYQRHKPQLGGYYVKYEDGYSSYSPAEAFEGGYTRYLGEPNTLASLVGRKCEIDFLNHKTPLPGNPAVAVIHAVDGPMVQMSAPEESVEDAFWINLNQIAIFRPV